MGKKAIGLTALIVIMILVISACSSAGSTNSEIKIGWAGPLTGDSSQDGTDLKQATELAVKLANEAGGIDSKQVKLVTQDDKADPKEAAIVANKLVSDKNVIAVVGHYNSSATLAAAPIYNKNKVVEISPTSSSPNVSDAGPYTFRTTVTDAFQGDFTAKWVLELGYESAAIIYENTDFGVGLFHVFQQSYEAEGGKVADIETYIPNETKDFSTVLTKIKAENPDVIFIAGLYNEAALIAKQAKTLDIQVPLIGGDSLYTQAFLDLGKEAVEGTFLPGFFNADSERSKVQEFVAAYEKEYGVVPGAFSAQAFDAAQMILEGIRINGATRQGVADYLTDLQGFEGAGGIYSFDPNGDALKEPEKFIVRSGNFEVYKP